MSRKWGGKSLQNLFLNSKENMKQQHVASANSPATVLETAVYINVLAYITECIALDSRPEDRKRAQPCCITHRKRSTRKGNQAAPRLQLSLAQQCSQALAKTGRAQAGSVCRQQLSRSRISHSGALTFL